MIKQFNISNNLLSIIKDDNAVIELYIDPTDTEKKILEEKYNIDEHTISSALDPDEVSRLEFDPDYIFMLWKRPKNYSQSDEFVFNVSSAGIFLIKNKMVIILPDDITILEPRRFLKINTPVEVVLNFLYQSIQQYLEHLKVIKQISRDIQQKINLAMENEHLIIMFNLSESLVYYLNAISSNNTVLMKLRNNAEKMGFTADDIEILDDILIENNQCFKQAEIYSNILSGLMDARGTLVNNNMNVLIKNLTIINVIFLPLNLIASIGGMSEFSIWTEHIDWRLSYSAFALFMILIAYLTAYFINKINWFNKGFANLSPGKLIKKIRMK
jgi:magnesium transporter